MSHVDAGPDIKARANTLVSQVFEAQLDILQCSFPLSGWMAGYDDGDRFIIAAVTGLFSQYEMSPLSRLPQGEWDTGPDHTDIYFRTLTPEEHNFFGLPSVAPATAEAGPSSLSVPPSGPNLIKIELICPGSAICVYVLGLANQWPDPKLQEVKEKVQLSLKAMGLIAALYTELSVASERVIEMQRDAYIDSLTAVLNRAGWNHRLDRVQAQSTNSSTDTAIIMLDLDFLKEINDSQGHTAGDDLLRLTAQTILSVLRGSDAVARLGGDEFGIVVKNASIDSVNTLISRLKQAFAKVDVNISMGGALASECNGQVLNAVQLADARMYAHKRGKPTRIQQPIDWMIGGANDQAINCIAGS